MPRMLPHSPATASGAIATAQQFGHGQRWLPLLLLHSCCAAVIAPDVLQGVLQRVRQVLPAPLALGEVPLNKFAKGPKEVRRTLTYQQNPPGCYCVAFILPAPHATRCNTM
jgi:hypothetical protein